MSKFGTTLIFEFKKGNETQNFKFKVSGDNFEQIKKHARELQTEIFEKFYGGKSMVMKVKFESGEELVLR